MVGETNWHAYAQHVVAEGLARGLPLTLTPQDVQAVPTSAYPTRAPRPHNSRLDTSQLRKTFSLELPDWREGVSAVVAEIAHHRAQSPTK
jgi:dTDP-4-dehydrorhamnose reductase